MNVVLTARVPVALAEELHDSARIADRTVSSTVRLAIRDYLDKNGLDADPLKTSEAAPAQDGSAKTGRQARNVGG